MGNISFRFNNGKITLVCPNCDKVIKTGDEMTKEEWEALEGGVHSKSIYCDDCKDKVVDLDYMDKSKLGQMKDILPILSNDPEFRENLMKAVSEKMFKKLNPNQNNE